MKTHLTVRESPLDQGSQVEALCGAEIFPCQIVCMWDSVLMGESLPVNSLLVCRKCCASLPLLLDGNSPKMRRYVYGVIKGEIQNEEAA